MSRPHPVAFRYTDAASDHVEHPDEHAGVIHALFLREFGNYRSMWPGCHLVHDTDWASYSRPGPVTDRTDYNTIFEWCVNFLRDTKGHRPREVGPGDVKLYALRALDLALGKAHHKLLTGEVLRDTPSHGARLRGEITALSILISYYLEHDRDGINHLTACALANLIFSTHTIVSCAH